MKNLMYLLVATGILATSCKKTFQCKDQGGFINGEVKAYSQSKADEMCHKNGSETAVLKPKNAPPPVHVTMPCETNGTGNMTFVNKSTITVKIILDGNVPAGFERVEPGATVSADVKGGIKMQFKTTEISGKTGPWSGELLVNTCESISFDLAL